MKRYIEIDVPEDVKEAYVCYATTEYASDLCELGIVTAIHSVYGLVLTAEQVKDRIEKMPFED